MVFAVDSRIEMSSVLLADWTLSRLYFKKDANFPWIILVPREENVQEIYQLSSPKRQILTEEIAAISQIMRDYFQPEKLNIGALGNIVSQLHVHVVARFKEDKAWPHSIWQPNLTMGVYAEEVLNNHVNALKERIALLQVFR
ncbi:MULTISPECIES: HIT family protein [Legionella]|uniref:Diadenosine tetraphosphate (Ap4A) hydrolase-like HIT family hydrolase n=1 Tax=Legionella maceachernii TaxID=466 RepID=A0A0W0VW61_9GAMM|nr:HIT domain-containing protein [Legionella maceachernii]KTD24548.1 diadenosine tetraphosphate (Ap4A) hydrolase-like HIT family hydrolase [Legionella maceachernii]SJZ62180.1 HIT domain-containing protein [Legionella maceachernii]SUP00959.1 HIT domain [Legionella maceachernii]